MKNEQTCDTQNNGQESIPLQEISAIDYDTEDEDSNIKSLDNTDTVKHIDLVVNESSFIQELKNNTATRFNVLMSVCVCLAYMVQGWSKGQLGPAFLDLLNISNTDLKRGSGFMTSYFAGRLIGAILAGVIHSRTNRYLMFVVSMIVNAISVAAIPWCVLYELMMTAHALHGISGGVLDVAITSEGVSIWGDSDRGRSYFQILCAAFAVSGIFAPMATAPFLLPIDTTETQWNITSTAIYVNISLNNNQPTYPGNDTVTSRLYIAYSMSAGLTLLVSIPFIILFLKSGIRSTIIINKTARSSFIGHLPQSLKRFQFLNALLFSSMFSAIDLTFGGYLTVFCVRYLNWTKTHGAILTSLILFAQLIGRILGAFVVRILSSHAMLMLSTVVCSLGFVGITISAYVQFDIGIWISVSVTGIPLGILWPGFVSWTNTNLIPVTGKVSSSLFVSAFTGAMLSPLLLGYMMEEISMLWFCYISLCESCVCIISALLMVWYTKYARANDSYLGISLVNLS